MLYLLQHIIRTRNESAVRLPLIAYNYASGSHERMNSAVRFALGAGLTIASIAAAHGVCLYRCGVERFLLEVHAPKYKEALFGGAGGKF